MASPIPALTSLMLWASAMEQDFAAPIWMTFKQALELKAHVRKGEKGSLVVYANSITRSEHDDDTGEDIEREIPFLKGYTVFNVEQIDGLPEIYYAKAESQLTPVERIARAEEFFKHIPVTLKHGGNRAYYAQELDYVKMPIIEAFRDAESYYATLGHEFIRPSIRCGWPAISGARPGAMKDTPARNSLPSWEAHSCAPIWS
jgi:antirestriction protein ArdC